MSFIKLNAKGGKEVEAHLKLLARWVPTQLEEAFDKAADHIVDEAKLNTPVDTHALEDSIRRENETRYLGKLAIRITCGGMVDGVNVDAYAVQVHENYEGMLRNGPGILTRKKMAANPGRIIGSKFLERALEAERERLMKISTDIVKGADINAH